MLTLIYPSVSHIYSLTHTNTETIEYAIERACAHKEHPSATQIAVLGARWVRAAALFYPRARRSPGARRGPRPWATPRLQYESAERWQQRTKKQQLRARNAYDLGADAERNPD